MESLQHVGMICFKNLSFQISVSVCGKECFGVPKLVRNTLLEEICNLSTSSVLKHPSLTDLLEPGQN